MISIVVLINVTEWIKNCDNSNDNYIRIEESINSVVEQTYKQWELRIALYGSGHTNALFYELKKYETKYQNL